MVGYVTDHTGRRKFRSQTSDNMDRWKAEQGRGREKRKSQKKEDADARKCRKVAKHCVFPMICGSGGSKSRLAKAAGAEPGGQMRDEKLHAVVARTHLEVKMYKTQHCRTTFGSWDVEKVHAAVARSTFPSQNVQNTSALDHFWKLRCRKSARRCGAKHISKSKCTKRLSPGPLLEVEMSKKCTPLWREAHFEVKVCKTPHVRATFGGSDVEKVHAVVARSTCRSQNVKNTRVSDHFWRFRCRFTTLHYTTLHSTTLHYTTLHNTTTTTTQLHSTTLHNTKSHHATLHYITLHYTTLHYTTLHYLPRHFTTLHYTPLHYNYNYTTTLHYNTLHYTKLHYTTLHYTTIHYTTLNYTTQHYLPLHFTTLHYTTLHYNYEYTTTTLHYTTLHYSPLHSTTLHSTTLHYITLHYITLNDTAPQIDRSTDR